MSDFNSVLTLQKMVFDRIEFNRKGFKNNKELEFELQVQIGLDKNSTYKVTLVLNGIKQDELDDAFAEYSWYFRNALVRAYYNDLTRGIHATTEYLEHFFGNLLLGTEYELKNRNLVIDDGFL